MSRYGIIDYDTGEVFDGTGFKITKPTKQEKFPELTKEDVINDESGRVKEYLRKYLFVTNNINEYSQIKVEGVWVNDELFDLAIENGYMKEILKLMRLTCAKHNKVKNHPTGRKTARTWTELYTFLGVHPSRKKKFREFLIKHDIARHRVIANTKLETDKSIYVNPLYFRKYSHVGKNSILAFKDIILPSIHKYSVYYLYKIGDLNEEDI